MLKNFKTFQLSVELFRETEKLKLRANLKDQLHRCCSSVALNLAEGYGRQSRKDKKRFYEIALGSLRETQAVLDLTMNDQLNEKVDLLGAYLYRLIKAFE